MSLFKHFPGWDASFLNGVISIKAALAHIDLSFLSVFFQLADDFNIHGWVEWVLFPLAKQGEMPGNYLLDLKDVGKPHARPIGQQ